LTTTTPAPLSRPNTSCSNSHIEAAQPEQTAFKPPKREPVDLAAIRDQIRASMAALDRLFPLQQMPKTIIPLQQPECTPFTPRPSPMTPEPPKCKPVDLAAIQQQIRASMAALDRLFPMTMLPLQPQQPASTLPPSAPPSTTLTVLQQREPFVLTDHRPQCHNNTDHQDKTFSLAPLPTTTQTTTQQPAADPLAQTSASLATSTLDMMILSCIDRLLHNTCTHNPLWIPDAFLRSPNPNQPTGTSMLPVPTTAHTTDTVFFPALFPHNFNNPLAADYATKKYTPAFNIHLPWQINCQKFYLWWPP